MYIYVFCSSQQVELFNLHLDISWKIFGCIMFFVFFIFVCWLELLPECNRNIDQANATTQTKAHITLPMCCCHIGNNKI